jgi:Ca-activated chloride channel homolog
MNFIWPIMLLALLVLPLLVVLYLASQRRRKYLLEQFSKLGMDPLGRQTVGRFKRHFPALLYFLAIACLIFAMSRPQIPLQLPRVGGTVVLTFDVSGSMAATDIEPTRMEASKAAARSFVENLPGAVQIGVVAFAEGGISVQAPTHDRTPVLAAINRLAPQRGTSLAGGISTALKAIENAERADDTDYYSRTPREEREQQAPAAVPPGTFSSSVIVLLTDGENNIEPDPSEAVQAAIDRGVRVHTIGIGDPAGVTLKANGFTVQTKLDEATLQAISESTRGTYFNARSGQDLTQIYDTIGSRLTVRAEQTELTAILAGIGTLLLVLGAALSMWWLGRAP